MAEKKLTPDQQVKVGKLQKKADASMDKMMKLKKKISSVETAAEKTKLNTELIKATGEIGKNQAAIQAILKTAK